MLEVSTTVAAPADRVWSLVGDPTRMGEWSPECARVEWIGPATGPAVGARFKGHNRRGWRRWTTLGTVARYEPGREVAWDVNYFGFAVSRWSYLVEPAGDGTTCRLVERFEDHRGPLFHLLGPAARGVRDTEAHNRAGMEQTLARIKAAAESAESPVSGEG
ncbi:MAG TPA: SRPBCC family protein [Candidatus Eisenbacteria bacterium]|nr:SRPBCC family protein [Candidatus Eisenbacteria bacterium]